MIQQIGRNEQTVQAPTKQSHDTTNASFEQILIKNIEQSKHTDLGETIYNELANDYDIRNATFDEIKEIAHKLYDSGVINFKELGLLTFDYGRATENIKAAVKGNVSPNFSMYETTADAFGKRDWLAEYEARAAKDRQYGNFIGHANKTKILEILQSIAR